MNLFFGVMVPGGLLKISRSALFRETGASYRPLVLTFNLYGFIVIVGTL